MNSQSFTKGSKIFVASDINFTMGLIISGRVAITIGNHQIVLSPGDIVGALDFAQNTYSFEYVALSSVEMIPYVFNEQKGLWSLLQSDDKLLGHLFRSFRVQIGELISLYLSLKNDYDSLGEFVNSLSKRYLAMCQILQIKPKLLPASGDIVPLSGQLPFWLTEYYSSVNELLNEPSRLSAGFAFGFLAKSAQDIAILNGQIGSMAGNMAGYSALLINESGFDFYDIYSQLYFTARDLGNDPVFVLNTLNQILAKVRELGVCPATLIDARQNEFNNLSMPMVSSVESSVSNAVTTAKLSNAVNEILEFADTVNSTAGEFRRCIDAYRSLDNRDSESADVVDLKKRLTSLFYIIYSDVVTKAIKQDTVPVVIKMFINFGFVDAELAGMNNAIELYEIADKFNGNPSMGIYTMLEWFKAVFEGRKLPSRNEFAVDYAKYVRTLVKEGRISIASEEEMLTNGREKIIYELNNMFNSVNRMTYGRPHSFCPVLSESNLLKNPKQLLSSPDKLLDCINFYKDIDYSVFFHEYNFEDYKFGIKETVYADIRPDIILTPNVGNRVVLWQEIEGMNRRSPGRVCISALYADNLNRGILRSFAEFRWEMCKRDNGMRWSDVTSHCLTGEYYDYAQFYSKNKELSIDAKDKIRENLKRCRNNYKELFINDYINYMIYEIQGSVRLNKAVRDILFKFAPPSMPFREKLATNQLFDEVLQKIRIEQGQALHRLDMIETKYRQAGKDIPREIEHKRAYVTR